MERFYFLFFFVLLSFCVGYAQPDPPDDCIVDAGVELTPGPTIDPFFTGLSTYASETTVQMCYTVEQYNTPGTQNWMHGIIPLFGPGWDLSTLQPVGQPETQFWSGGEWIWVDNITAGITGEFINSPGWFFDAGSGGGTLDGDPTDNWGDGNNGPWTFCWEITTQSCPPQFNEASLIVEILNFADSETGSWNNPDALAQCIDDPSYYIQGLQLDCPTCDDSILTVYSPTCENIDETGGVVIVEPQGIGPWNYIWFNLDSGEIVEENFNIASDVFSVGGLEPGEYLIQVEDLGFAGGCSAGQTFFILPPEDILVEFDVSDANCSDLNDGSIEISSIMNSNCIDPDLIAEDINSDGVIDNNDFSCPSTADEVCGCDFVTYFNSCQAENWYGITAYELGDCSGFPNYDIVWTSSNSMESPNWDGEIINLLPGEYTVSITNSDNTSPVFGCDFQTTVTVGSPDQFISDFTINDISCFIDDNDDGINDISDGSITINLIGGTAPYTIFAGSLDGLDLGSQDGNPIVFDNLSAGDYFFTPLDFFGCMVETQEVFFSISEPGPLALDGDVVISDYTGFGVSCNGGNDGFINIDILGGTGSYEFEWSNGDSSQNLTNVSEGTYSCIISDENNCELVLSDLVLTAPNTVSIIATEIIPVSCSGASDGSISIDISGGVSPYDFVWSGPGGFFSNTPNISNVSTGEYIITVIDDNGCEYQETFNVTTPNPIIIDSSVSDVSCFTFDDGEINITISGGNSPYTFDWSNGSSDEDLNNLPPGIYELIVFDNEGCFENAVYEISEPLLLTASVTTEDVDCFGDNTGSANANISGGTPPYTETWSGGANPNNLFAGLYDLTISDFNDCVFVISDILIDQPDSELELTASVTDVYPCNGGQNGSIDPVAIGGTPPYVYFSPGVANFNALSAGLYTVTVTDGLGCEADMNFFVDEPDAVSANLTVTSASCFGLNDGQASAIPIGGTAPYTLTWIDASGNSVDIDNLFAGSYLLSIEDALGCTYSEVFVVSEPSPSDIEVLLDDEASCLDPFSVSVVGILGSGGSWSGSGPGNVVFSDPFSSQTEVTVFEYGVYDIVFTNDCGEEIILPVSMMSIPPSGVAIPPVAYCDFETSLEGISNTSSGFWTVLEAPENTNVNIENPSSFNTEVFMTPINSNQECCYGDYLFEFNSCGEKDIVPFSIQKSAPDFGISTFEDCILDASIFIENPISFTDVLIDPGSWEWEAVGNDGVVSVDYSTPYAINFSVSEYGLYEFRYLICDTFYQHFVGFSCPLQLPNAFTPNGDMNNDAFLGNQLIPFIHSQINFTVYNRFGQIVHAQNNYDFQGHLWDGTTNTFEDKSLNDGVYYYVLELFNNANRRKERYNGFVYLFNGIE